MESNDKNILQDFFDDERLSEINRMIQQVVNGHAVQTNKDRLLQQAIERNKQIQQALLSQLTTGLPPSQNKRSFVDLREDKEQWVKDVIDILTNGSGGGTKQAAIKRITDKWTRINGNYNGCKLWTINALEEYKRLGCPIEETGLSKYFTHEHAMPQNAFIKIFLKPQTHFAVLALLYNGLNGVVVTKAEDAILNKKYQSKMPESFSNPKNSFEEDLCYLNPWARYIEVDMTRDIQICEWDKDGKLISHEDYNIRTDVRIDPETEL
ncbi:hypothetical protein V8V54_07650 [Priestia megaterium]|uniref:hypothetical protein n=1 Tax=Priestia megaterium TaxID=1404 RepID=UPI000BF7418B|nr:hypothetical protein [Priestia megaterium]MCM3152255.1 hypothetical protein [Priestia megaterium]PFW52822.1 hypothetical protein COL17_01575 [Priestia megaterium]